MHADTGRKFASGVIITGAEAVTTVYYMGIAVYNDYKFTHTRGGSSAELDAVRQGLAPTDTTSTFELRQYAKSDALLRATLESQERTIGAKNCGTLHTKCELANVYYAQGRFPEAELLLVSTLAAQERVLGREHHDTLGTLYRLQRAAGGLFAMEITAGESELIRNALSPQR